MSDGDAIKTSGKSTEGGHFYDKRKRTVDNGSGGKKDLPRGGSDL